MKKFITTFLMLVPIYCFSQKIDTIPFKNCDKVIVKNSLTGPENFKLIKKILTDDEIEILNQDAEALQLKTANISLNNKMLPSANYYLTVFAKDNQISIRGYFKAGITQDIGLLKFDDGYQVAKLVKPKQRHLIFEKIQSLVKSIDGKIFYSSDSEK